MDIGGGTIEVTDPGTTLTATGPISALGPLTKAGPGALTFSGGLSGASALNVNAGTLTLGVPNSFSGETIVNNGGTLALNFGAIAGALGGTLTINSGGTVLDNAKDALGYGPARVTTININGGTYTHTSANNVSIWGMAVNMTGGAFQATDPAGMLDFGTNANAGDIPTAVNTLASANTATIGGTRVNLRQSNTTFTVAKGAAISDLLVSAPVTRGLSARASPKTGPGRWCSPEPALTLVRRW